MDPVELLVLLVRAASVGIPAIIEGVAKFKATSGRNPTVEEILAITADLKPPEAYK